MHVVGSVCKVRQARKTWRGRQSNASILLPQCHAWCGHTQVVTFEKGGFFFLVKKKEYVPQKQEPTVARLAAVRDIACDRRAHALILSGQRTPAPAMGRSADRLRFEEPRCGHSRGRPGQDQKGWIHFGLSGLRDKCRLQDATTAPCQDSRTTESQLPSSMTW
jgi:hypothetical protein